MQPLLTRPADNPCPNWHNKTAAKRENRSWLAPIPQDGGGRSMALPDWLFGRPLATYEEGEQRVGVVAGIPMLGLDALSSAAYGPEAALTLLIPLGAAGVGYIGPISALIIALLFVVYFSY